MAPARDRSKSSTAVACGLESVAVNYRRMHLATTKLPTQKNGSVNAVRKEDLRVHDWYRFVLCRCVFWTLPRARLNRSVREVTP